MTLRELVNKCFSIGEHWAEILVFDNEEDINKFAETGNELGIQFVIKGEYSLRPIKDEVLDAYVEFFYPIKRNEIAVFCQGLFEKGGTDDV